MYIYIYIYIYTYAYAFIYAVITHHGRPPAGVLRGRAPAEPWVALPGVGNVGVYMCISLSLYIYIYKHNVYTYTYVYLTIYIYIYVHIYIYTYIIIYIYIYVYIFFFALRTHSTWYVMHYTHSIHMSYMSSDPWPPPARPQRRPGRLYYMITVHCNDVVYSMSL